MLLNNDALPRSAAQLLAAAVVAVFPETQLVGGGVNPVGFYYDFVFPFSFQQKFLPLIEERMRQFIKEKRPFRLIEMVPVSAAGFLKNLNQPLRAERASGSREVLLQLLEIGDFCDLAPGDFLNHAGEVGSFKLQESRELPSGDQIITRLTGCADQNPQKLKELLKQKPKKNHLQLGMELDLFSLNVAKDYFIWHPRGQQLRETLIQWWRKAHRNQKFAIVSSSPPHSFNAALDLLRSNSSSRFAEISYIFEEGGETFLDRKSHWRDCSFLMCEEEQLLEETISFLQLIDCLDKIFAFKGHWVLSSPTSLSKKRRESFVRALHRCGIEPLFEESDKVCLELRLSDVLGREWACSTLSLERIEGKKRVIVSRSVFGSLDRFIALLLEQSQGERIFWENLVRLENFEN